MNAVEKMFVGHEDSLKQFDAWRLSYVDSDGSKSAQPVEKILLPWATNKAGLYQMFGQNLIISKHVEYQRSEDEIVIDMEQMLRNQRAFTETFFARLAEELDLIPNAWRSYAYANDGPAEEFYYTMKWAFNEHNLMEARLNQAVSAVIRGQKMQFANGQKSMRAIGKVARALGLEQEFEKFRVAHSMVLNQAKLSGKLCLSIHPLDFATASDNESGWSSCMSWREGGSYRLGTVEMMTSPCVICAYLASDSVKMDIGNGTWPSKKWRAWVIVTDNFIVVNRNYPYDNEDLSRACVDWVKEMASEYYDTRYEETHNHWDQGEYIDIDMNYMYNDLGEGHIGCYANGVTDLDYSIAINVSGPAICMWCGEEIPYGSDDDAAYTLCCNQCSGRVQCSCCGDSISEDCVYYGPDDEPYCENCYNERFASCEHCDNVVNSEDMYSLVVPVDSAWLEDWVDKNPPKEHRTFSYRPNELGCYVCEDCVRDAGIDPEEDLDWNVKMPFSHETLWGYTNSWNGAMIDPDATTWDKLATLFGYRPDDPMYAAIWDHYCECIRTMRQNEDSLV